MLFGYFVNFGNSIIFFLSRLGEDAPLKFPYGVSIINDFIYLLSPHLYLLRLKLPLRLRQLRKGALPDGRLCSSRVYCLAHVLALPRTAYTRDSGACEASIIAAIGICTHGVIQTQNVPEGFTSMSGDERRHCTTCRAESTLRLHSFHRSRAGRDTAQRFIQHFRP